MIFIDPVYIVVFILSIIVSFGAQMYIQSAYGKWSQVRNGAGLNGQQVARVLIERTRLGDTTEFGMGGISGSGIKLAAVPGQLTDHYDPRTHTVRFSEPVGNRNSVVSMAVAAHELGHAQQHEEHSPLIAMRNFLVPAVQISPQVSYFLILIGLLFNLAGALWLGIIFFGLTVLFALLTIPVEVNASRRGLAMLTESGLMVTENDRRGSRAVLTAAAMTYIAAAVTAVLQLLYYVSLARRRS